MRSQQQQQEDDSKEALQDNADFVSTLTSDKLEKWSRLAERLRSKLDSTQRENKSLKDRLDRQTTELEDLRDEHTFFNDRIDDLEFQCLEKSAKIANLTEIIETKGNTNELQENFLQKSMKNAEMSLSIDRLRHALQKCESANQHLLEEKDSLTAANAELSMKAEEATLAWQQSRKEQERNRKLLIELGDVVRTLNCATIEFEKETEGKTGASSQQNPLDNIKRKIQAMEQDRQRLITECASLRKDNDSKHQQIQDLQSQCQSLSESIASGSTTSTKSTPRVHGGMGPLDSRLDSQTSPVSIDTQILEQEEEEYEYEEPVTVTSESQSEHTRSFAATVLSSFSELDPPEVPFDDHERLKRYYEDSLERIIRMSTELNKSKEVVKELSEKKSYISELKERLEQMREERDETRKENTKLEHDLKEALTLAENATSNHSEVVRANETQKAEYRALKEKYDRLESLESDYSTQLGELESQVAETERFFELKCEGLKKQHMEKMQKATDELEKLQMRHGVALNAEKDKYDQLNEEFDVFMEMHTQLEDDLSSIREKYDEALTNIVDLEEQLQQSKATSGEEKAKLETRLEAQSKAIKELKAAVDKSKEGMQEAIVQQQKLRRENDTILAKHGELVPQITEAKKQRKLDEETIAGLRDNCCDMEERLNRAKETSNIQWKHLRSSYEMALSKIKSLLVQLYSAGLPIEQSSGKMTKSNGLTNKTSSTIATENDTFQIDFSRILQQVAESKVLQAQRESSEQGLLHARLLHQIRLQNLHQLLMKRLSLFEAEEIADAGESRAWRVDSSFLEHQRRLNFVHHEFLSKVRNLEKDPSLDAALSVNNVEVKIWKESEDIIAEENSTAEKYKDESRTAKLAADTAKIRYGAREKDHRVIRLQYQKLLDRFNAAVKNSKEQNDTAKEEPDNSDLGQINKVKFAVQRIQQESELQRMQQELRDVELKMERMAMELRMIKPLADAKQRKQEAEETNLKNAIDLHEEQAEAKSSLDQEESGEIQSLKNRALRHPIHPRTASQIFRDNNASSNIPVVEERRQEDSGGSSCQGRNGKTSTYKLVVSFDGSHLTSLPGLSHGGEERWEEEKRQIQLEGGIDRYIQQQKDHDKALRTIDELKAELARAERAAEHAQFQLKHREEDLRDIVREYNQIKEESDRLIAQIQEKVEEEDRNAEDEKKDDGEHNTTPSISSSNEVLIRERNMALGKISILESELEQAQAAAKAARKKQLLREDHLRQVIQQYKTLSQEHQKTKEQLDQLQHRAVDLHIACQEQQHREQEDPTSRTKHTTTSVPEGRQRSHEVGCEGEDKRDSSSHANGSRDDQAPSKRTVALSFDEMASTKTNPQNGKVKRKPWFLDLGHNRRGESRQQSTSSGRMGAVVASFTRSDHQHST